MDKESKNNSLLLVLVLVGAAYWYFYIRPGAKKKTQPTVDAPQDFYLDLDDIQGQQKKTSEKTTSEEKQRFVEYYKSIVKQENMASKSSQQQAINSRAWAYKKMILRHPVYRQLAEETAKMAGNTLGDQLNIEALYLLKHQSKLK